MKKRLTLILTAATTLFGLAVLADSAKATQFTFTSPTSGGNVPTGVTEVGGIVLDLIGQNDARVISQLAASETFVGFYNTNPGTIGTQTGFTTAVINALGGGLKEVGIRVTLDDGDTAQSNFDENDNTLLVNNLNFGNWSDVNAQNTDGLGNATAAGFSGGGFRNNRLDTGWFYSNNAALLNSFYNTLVATQQVVYQVDDLSPGDNFYDFTQGIDGGLVNVGQGPVVQPGGSTEEVPEPLTILGTLTAGAFGTQFMRKRKQMQAAKSEA